MGVVGVVGGNSGVEVIVGVGNCPYSIDGRNRSARLPSGERWPKENVDVVLCITTINILVFTLEHLAES